MKSISGILSLAICLMLCLPGSGKSGVDLGISIGEDGVEGFYLAIGERYHVEREKITVIKKRNLPDDEIPVAFFFARHAGVAPNIIVDLRLGGAAWMDIMLKYGLSPELLYIELKEEHGPPFGKAYGHFKKQPRRKWRNIRFTDVDIIEFVNIRFVAEHYGHSPDEVVKMRQKGSNFVKINAEVKKARKNKKAPGKYVSKEKAKKKKGKGRK